MKRKALPPLKEEEFLEFKFGQPVLQCQNGNENFFSICDMIETESKDGIITALYLHCKWKVPIRIHSGREFSWSIDEKRSPIDIPFVFKCENPRIVDKWMKLKCQCDSSVTIYLSLHLPYVFAAEVLKRDLDKYKNGSKT